eukprot:jgi/Mesvir1/28305/Mv04825-RA.1
MPRRRKLGCLLRLIPHTLLDPGIVTVIGGDAGGSADARSETEEARIHALLNKLASLPKFEVSSPASATGVAADKSTLFLSRTDLLPEGQGNPLISRHAELGLGSSAFVKLYQQWCARIVDLAVKNQVAIREGIDAASSLIHRLELQLGVQARIVKKDVDELRAGQVQQLVAEVQQLQEELETGKFTYATLSKSVAEVASILGQPSKSI